MTQLLQQLANGTVLGAQYALIALGYTMVYGIIQLINFAHGEIFMIGAFGGLAVYTYLLGSDGHALVVLPIVLCGAILCSTLIAVAMERFAYRPLRNAPRLAPLITAIGVSIVLQEGVRTLYPQGNRQQPFPTILPERQFTVGGVNLSLIAIFVVLVAIVMMVLLHVFVQRSKTGRAMRATSQDPDTAKLMGIDTNRIIVITFALGAALAAVAGVLQGMLIGQVDFDMGFIGGLKAFTAAVLGGIGHIPGAVLGGFLLGIVEAIATQYIPQGSAYKDVWAFVVLVLVLIFRPTGLLGRSVRTRA